MWEEVLTAIITTVRSAKAVITTFCRMLSWRDEEGDEDGSNMHTFILISNQSQCKEPFNHNLTCWLKNIPDSTIFKTAPSPVPHLVPGWKQNCVSLRAVLLQKIQPTLFVLEHVCVALNWEAAIHWHCPQALNVLSVFSFYFYSIFFSFSFMPNFSFTLHSFYFLWY